MVRGLPPPLAPAPAPEPVRRRAFRVGGSVAVRLPKALADAAGIADGTSVVFLLEGDRLVLAAEG